MPNNEEITNLRQKVSYAVYTINADLKALTALAISASEASSTTSLNTTLPPEEQIKAQQIRVQMHAPYSHAPSRCTIPMAMICFSAIEMIGQWLFDSRSLEKCFEVFFKQLAANDDIGSLTQNGDDITNAKRLADNFRNGVMHGFFAAKNHGLHFDISPGWSLISPREGAKYSLDVHYLKKVVVLGMDNLLVKVLDDEFCRQMLPKYKTWYSYQAG